MSGLCATFKQQEAFANNNRTNIHSMSVRVSADVQLADRMDTHVQEMHPNQEQILEVNP